MVYELVYRLGRQFAHKSPKAARVRCRNLQARSQLRYHGHHAVTQIAPIEIGNDGFWSPIVADLPEFFGVAAQFEWLIVERY